MSFNTLRSTRSAVVALAAIGTIAMPLVHAADAGASAPAGNMSSAMSSADRKFVMDAAQGGMTEVELGKLARQNGSNDAVKQFGSRMVQDHGKADDELMQLASAKGVQLPTSLNKAHQNEVGKYSKLNGADFDRQYMTHMVSDHKKDIAAFQKESNSAKDSDLKSFASKTLPTLKDHLQMAQSAQSAVTASR